MDPGYRSPLIDMFRRADTSREVRLLAAQGALSPVAHEQLALLILLVDDDDSEIALTAEATLGSLPAEALCGFLARADVPGEMREFFAERGVTPAGQPAASEAVPLIPPDDDGVSDEEVAGLATEPSDPETPAVISGLPIKAKMKLAFRGTREQRAQLIRDANRIVAAAVLSSPKLTEAEVESFAKMANVSEDVLRIIGTNRAWLKNYGTLLGLVRNPKTPPAISMQFLPRVNERDLKLLSMDRNVPEALKLAARKFVVKGPR